MLRVNRLSCRLGDVTVLNDVTFEVEAGESLAVVGPNGSGKTTLLRCLLGLLPFEGTVEFDGQDISGFARREFGRRMAYVPQLIDAVPGFTVEQFVLMGRYPHSTAFSGVGADDYAAAKEALELTGTASLVHNAMDTLSGGERQRVLLAAALCQQTDLLLLDEPGSYLDPEHQDELYRILARLREEQGKTILVVSHDINRAALGSRRLLALREGNLYFDGTPQEFMVPELLEQLYSTSFLLVEHPDSSVPVVVPRVP